MKPNLVFAAAFLLLNAAALQAVEITDHLVKFRLRAPNAREVKLAAQWTKEALPFVRGDDGTWTLSVETVPSGVWEYSFLMDGVSVIDSSNPALKPQREPSKSILHIASVPPAPWDWQDVPHGVVHQHAFASKTLGQREVWVYTPPGYESGSTLYPLLVLQHGSGDNNRAWVEHGKAHWILDSLIASGKAKPMVVLMLDGHPLGKVAGNDPARRDASLEAFRRELFEDAVPLVERQYRVAPGAQQRAIAGLSMGGWQSLTVGLNALDRFAWVGSFSGAADQAALQPALDNAASTNERLRLLWVACGKNDFLLERNQAIIAAFQKSGVKHEWHLTEGDHSWPVWRNYLVDFAPRLFQP